MREFVTGSPTNLAYLSTAQLFITVSDFDEGAAPVAIGIPLLYGMYNLRINSFEKMTLLQLLLSLLVTCVGESIMKYVIV